MIEIRAVGIASTVQDHGRPGLAHLGIGRSGAADRRAHDLANRLVGNDTGAATIETSGGLHLRVVAPVLVVLTGALCTADVIDGPPLGHAAPQWLPAGAVVRLSMAQRGLRTYLAVAGGFAVPRVLGSRSRDTLGAIGPQLAAGALLPIGAPADVGITDVAAAADVADMVVIEPGPRRGWFDDAAWAVLLHTPYTVGAQANRVGVRLHGTPLQRVETRELPSEGLVDGAIQVPPDGQPIVMLADHPVTGGYPVIAVVADRSMSVVAQAVPGSTLRFVARRG